MASRRGVVLALTKDMPTDGDMDWEATPSNSISRKRPLHVVETMGNTNTPCITCQPIGPIVIDDEVEEPDKKSRALENVMAQNPDSTQDLLLSAEHALQVPPNNASQASTLEAWAQVTVGVTPMLQNEACDVFKCINCDFKSNSALGVATHYGRYCTKKGVKEETIENVVEGNEDEDII